MDRSNPPPAEEVRASVTVKPGFDESYLPEGMYQLQAESETWRLQKVGATWEILFESVQKIMREKVRFVSPN